MIYRQLFHKNGTDLPPIRAGVIGTGHYATAILTQSRAIPGLEIRVVADVNLEAARAALRLAGWPDDEIVVCETRAAALRAIEGGHRAVIADALLMMDLPLDIIVEATGVAAAGALHGREALRHGKHLAMVTKETDVSVGPILKRLADREGLVYTAVDGDQHGLLIGLVDWARELGLEILCAGKALEFDILADMQAGRLACNGSALALPADTLRRYGPDPVPAEASVHRRIHLNGLCGLMGYDVTEMALAVNGTGLRPDIDSLHCPVLRITEIPEVLCPHSQGGILAHSGVVDAISCVRHPDEPGLAGGVFLVVGCRSEYSRKILREKGHISNRRGDAFLIFRPHHLCGVETPMSLLTAVRLGVPTGASDYRPRYDVIMRLDTELPAGAVIPGDKDKAVQALMRPSLPRVGGNPIPLHLASGCRLRVAAPAGATLAWDMVEPPASSLLWELRADQDRAFLDAS